MLEYVNQIFITLIFGDVHLDMLMTGVGPLFAG